MSSSIELTDWARILFGGVPYSFLIEAVIRSAFVYLILIVSMRLLGRRMASQMNVTEMTALVSLAAAVGIPMLSPDRGLLPALVIAFVIVLVGRLSAYFSTRNARNEAMIDGKINALVRDGVLQLAEMKAVRITRERVFARLRKEGLKHLGGVRRMYMESSGDFSIVPDPNQQAGLSIIPDWDTDLVREQTPTSRLVCQNCGAEKPSGARDKVHCRNCGNSGWVSAIREEAMSS